jgi:hypothetical protein
VKLLTAARIIKRSNQGSKTRRGKRSVIFTLMLRYSKSNRVPLTSCVTGIIRVKKCVFPATQANPEQAKTQNAGNSRIINSCRFVGKYSNAVRKPSNQATWLTHIPPSSTKPYRDCHSVVKPSSAMSFVRNGREKRRKGRVSKKTGAECRNREQERKNGGKRA